MRAILVTLVLFALASGQLIYGQTYTPKGTIMLDKKTYVDQYEVSNNHYYFYLKWLEKYKGENSVEYLSAKPYDKKIIIYFSPFDTIRDIGLDVYLAYPQYKKHPAVSLSHEQVIQFCKWVEMRINELSYINEHEGAKRNNLPDNIPQTYMVRLPSKDEWLKAANKTIKANNYNENGVPAKPGNSKTSNSVSYPLPVENKSENDSSCINMFGNVSEMTNVKGIAMGGSFADNSDATSFDKEIKYDQPENWLGFRCVYIKTKL